MASLKWILLLFSFSLWSQAEKEIAGFISVPNATPGGVRILNLVNQRETVSDDKGGFRIPAKPDDVLLFSAPHLDLMRHIVEDNEYEKGVLTLKMTAKTNQLEEVEVNTYPNINATSLGILEKPAKSYTPAERRLRSTRHVFISPVKGGGMGFSFDPVLNYLTGRTHRLKNELEVEKYPRALKRMQEWYDAAYYDSKFGITAEESGPFEYFCIEDEEFRESVIAGKRHDADLRIVFLATAFVQLKDGPVTEPKK